MSTGVSASSTVNPLLASYLAQLQAHPLRTKALTSGTLLHSLIQTALTQPLPKAALSFCQEVLGSFIAGVPVQHPPQDAPHIVHILARGHINLKALKMALYGFLVSAPLGHYLVGLLQKAFAGRTGPGAKVLQILASNLLVAPIQTVGTLPFLVFMVSFT
jgi:peroxisomal membrane protein 2